MIAKIFSATTIGIDAHQIEVEVDLSPGLLQFFIVGLPDTAIKESSRRIQTALKNSGIRLPFSKRITVNLAPADLKKVGTLFDLPIAIGILVASGELELDQGFASETLFVGELSLDGSIRFVKGVLAIAYDALKLGKTRIVVPQANAQEAALIDGLEVIGVDHITQLVAYVRGECPISPTVYEPVLDSSSDADTTLDFAQVRGQYQAKRALQISAAGMHNILFIGSPGSGKTMLAKRLPSIMPKMTFNEVLETSKIYSIVGKLRSEPLISERPFRDPHHTISSAGLVGGGSYPQPGEISLAHNGILFLDELTEFKKTTLEVLRQPLESKEISIARANHSVHFPASFLLVAALNPCPCGYWGDKKRACSCSAQQVNNYLQKLSGPFLDRVDLQIQVQSVDYDTAKSTQIESLSSEQMREAVNTAVAMQKERFGHETKRNAAMGSADIEKFCTVTPAAQEVVKKAFKALHWSMRGYHKILKVARTIADLESSVDIDVPHIQEAIMYRSLDQALERSQR